MKIILDSKNNVVNADIDQLPPGKYLVFKKVETIVVVSSGDNRAGIIDRTASKSTSIDQIRARQSERSLNNNEYVGRIKYMEGVRYIERNDGKLEKFPENELKYVDDQLFSGYIIDGAVTWDYTNQHGFADDEPKPSTTEKSKNKDDLYDDEEIKPKSKGKKPKKKKNEDDIEELVKIAKAAEDDEEFDQDGFLGDLDLSGEVSSSEVSEEDDNGLSELEGIEFQEDKQSNSIRIEDDVVLVVEFEGNTYRKRFKTEKVASSQMDAFKELLKTNIETVKEMLYGSISTFTKVEK